MKIKHSWSLFFIFLLTGFSGYEKPTEPKDSPRPDTTSHNFVWDVDTIGYRNTTLSDAVIINENDMWVAGEIYPDSASYRNGPRHGLAHWDGKKWTPEVVMVRAFFENPDILTPGVFVSIKQTPDENQIFLASRGGLFVKSGSNWKALLYLSNTSIDFTKYCNGMWVNSSQDIFLFGLNGGLFHYNGTSLTSIPTNTSLDILDMHGDWNPKTGEYELLALATRMNQIEGNLLLKIVGHTVVPIDISGLSATDKSHLWFSQGSDYWVAGWGTFFKQALTDTVWKEKMGYPNSWRSTTEVNGYKASDLFVLQTDWHILHYNGVSWKDLKTEIPISGASFYKVILNKTHILILGLEDHGAYRGIVLRGKRKD